MKSDKELARDLIGTKFSPGGWNQVLLRAMESRAYFEMNPYPYFAFNEWRLENLGPYPKALPFVANSINRGVNWLFGESPQVLVQENLTVEKIISQAWIDNQMGSKMRHAARLAAIEGSVALKFSYDETYPGNPIRLTVLSTVTHVKHYCHPHDYDQLLMVRIQYPYFDAEAGSYFFYREEWTAEEHVIYETVRMDTLVTSQYNNPYSGVQDPEEGRFEIKSRKPNPFGVIPVGVIHNIEDGTAYGVGDFWNCYRMVDRINLAFHLMDKSNQTDVTSQFVVLDGLIETDDMDRPPAISEPLSISSTEGNKASVHNIEKQGFIRPALMEYARELMNQVVEAGGSIQIRPEEVTNKGNMTVAVLSTIYDPQRRSTINKREAFGEFGIVRFMENLTNGLHRLGVKDVPEGCDVSIQWAPIFDYTPDEKSVITGTTLSQLQANVMTKERAVHRIAMVEGIRDLNSFKDELARGENAAANAADQSALDQAETPDKVRGPLDHAIKPVEAREPITPPRP